MALIRAMNSAISGLMNHQKRIDVIGNNIANVNTTSFKASRAHFQSQFSQNLSMGSSASGALGGVNPMQIGLGTNLGDVSLDFTQGSLETTGVASDVAIEGDGFFILADGQGTPVYSRDGAFRRNTANELVHPALGFKVQGWNADSSFNINTGGATSTIMVNVGSQSIANATTSVALSGNFNAQGATLAYNGTKTGVQLFLTGGGPALGSSLVTALSLTSGGSALFSAGDQIQMAAKKGGRDLPTQTYTVSATTTLSDIMTFMDQALGINSSSTAMFGFNRLSDDTVATATGATATTITDTSTNFVTAGVAVGDIIRFTSGTAAGTTAVVTAVAANTLTVSSWSTTPATGDKFSVHSPPGVTVDSSGNVIVAGNAGEASALTDFNFTKIPTSGSNSTPFSFTQTVAADGESHHTSFTAYDSLGRGHIVNVTMVMELQNSTATTWRYYANTDDDTDIDLVTGQGTISFDTDGLYTTTAPLTNQISIDLASSGAVTPLVLSLDMSEVSFLGDGESDVNILSQDGFAMGVLDSFSIGQTGIITGYFTNGLTRDIAQIALARFNNNNGLVSMGKNLYGIGTNSGPALVGVAGSGSRGLIRGGTLEEANVDLSREFTDLITTQRGFQANARVISTADDMLNELVNLRR